MFASNIINRKLPTIGESVHFRRRVCFRYMYTRADVNRVCVCVLVMFLYGSSVGWGEWRGVAGLNLWAVGGVLIVSL